MIYLFYGEEQFLIENKIEYIKKNFFNNLSKEEQVVDKIDFKEDGITSFLEDFEQLSFDFLDKKIYLVYNSIFLTQENQFKKLKQNEKDLLQKILIENVNDFNKCLIFISYDNKLINNNIINIFPKDNISLINKIKPNKWADLIYSQYKTKGYKIDEESVNEIIKRCNYNYQIYVNESIKLFLFCDDKNITLEDVKKIFSYSPDDNIFNLSNAILSNDKDKIFNSYYDLKLMGKQIVYIINSLSTSLIFIDQVLYLKSLNKDYISISNILGANAYRVKITCEAKITRNKIVEMIDNLYKLDRDIKLGNIESYLGFELFLSKI